MPAPAYDHYAFDLDGTLVDVEPAYVQDVFDRVGDRLGYGFTAEQAEALWHGLGGFRDDQLAAWGLDRDAFWRAFHAEEDGRASRSPTAAASSWRKVTSARARPSSSAWNARQKASRSRPHAAS